MVKRTDMSVLLGIKMALPVSWCPLHQAVVPEKDAAGHTAAMASLFREPAHCWWIGSQTLIANGCQENIGLPRQKELGFKS